MTAAEIVQHFGAKSVGRNQWQARCPAHADKNPSLSIGIGSDGRVLLNCHAGCSVDDILAASGLKFEDLFAKSVSDETIKFSYRDTSGSVVFHVCRRNATSTQKKRIWQEANGRKGIPDTFKQDASRPLYRLPEVIKSSGPLLMLEGEPHADKLWSMNIPATTTSQGAGNAKFTDLKPLVGRHIILCPDNDRPGRDHMADIATRLVALGQPPEHLRWLELPGLPEKGDILDWIQEGHSADELHNLMDSATVYPISVNVSGISVPFLSTDSNNPKPLPNNESGDIGNCVNSVPEWENPIPLESGDRTGPSFPVEALPDWLRDWVIAESQSTQTPTDLAGVLALGVLSACLANAATVEARKGWRESLSLYILVGLPSGERKSPVFRDATRPLEDLEAADIQAAKPDIAKKQAERDLLERQLADATASAAKGKGKTLLDVQEAAEALEKCRVPSAPRFLVEDVTIERIATILAGQPAQRLAVMSAEGGFFTTISGRYSEHPAFDLLLKAYTGEPFRVDRVGRPPDILKTPALSLVMAVQPSVIKDLAEFRPFKDRGLLARILFVLPQSFVGKRAPDPPEMPDTIQERYYQRIADLFRVGLQYAALADDIPPVTLYLTTEARQALRAYMTEIEPQLAMNGSLGPLAGWGNKLAGTMLRIAGLLHCAEQPLEDRTIDKEMIDRAIVLTRYLTGHAQVAFSMMESPPETHAAQIILDYLRSHGLHEFTKRQLYRELRAIFKNSRDIDGPLAVLSDHAFIRIKKEEEDPSSPRRGRPPSPVFEFTPLDRIDTIDKNPENAGSTRISQGSQFVDRNGTKIPATLTEMSDPPLEEVKVVGARF